MKAKLGVAISFLILFVNLSSHIQVSAEGDRDSPFDLPQHGIFYRDVPDDEWKYEIKNGLICINGTSTPFSGVLYHHPTYEGLKKIREMGFNLVDLTPYIGKVDDETLSWCEELGLFVMLELNFKPSSEFWQVHSEYAFVQSDNTTDVSWWNWNSHQEELKQSILTEMSMSETFDIINRHGNVIIISGPNEVGTMGDKGGWASWDMSTIRMWRKWLQCTYGSLESVNLLYGTDWASWNEVYPLKNPDGTWETDFHYEEPVHNATIIGGDTGCLFTVKTFKSVVPSYASMREQDTAFFHSGVIVRIKNEQASVLSPTIKVNGMTVRKTNIAPIGKAADWIITYELGNLTKPGLYVIEVSFPAKSNYTACVIQKYMAQITYDFNYVFKPVNFADFWNWYGDQIRSRITNQRILLWQTTPWRDPGHVGGMPLTMWLLDKKAGGAWDVVAADGYTKIDGKSVRFNSEFAAGTPTDKVTTVVLRNILLGMGGYVYYAYDSVSVHERLYDNPIRQEAWKRANDLYLKYAIPYVPLWFASEKIGLLTSSVESWGFRWEVSENSQPTNDRYGEEWYPSESYTAEELIYLGKVPDEVKVLIVNAWEEDDALRPILNKFIARGGKLILDNTSAYLDMFGGKIRDYIYGYQYHETTIDFEGLPAGTSLQWGNFETGLVFEMPIEATPFLKVSWTDIAGVSGFLAEKGGAIALHRNAFTDWRFGKPKEGRLLFLGVLSRLGYENLKSHPLSLLVEEMERSKTIPTSLQADPISITSPLHLTVLIVFCSALIFHPKLLHKLRRPS